MSLPHYEIDLDFESHAKTHVLAIYPNARCVRIHECKTTRWTVVNEISDNMRSLGFSFQNEYYAWQWASATANSKIIEKLSM